MYPRLAVTRTYERIARFYVLWHRPVEWFGLEWFGLAAKRRRLLSRACGSALAGGRGAGLNLDRHLEGDELTGIDVASGMLARARRRAATLGRPVRIEEADVRARPFESGSFDTAVATCVFCSVADSVAGLCELSRVVRHDDQVLLLDHVRPKNPLGWLLVDILSPLSSRPFGAELNRRTETYVERAGLDIRRDGVWREIVARPRRGSMGVTA